MGAHSLLKLSNANIGDIKNMLFKEFGDDLISMDRSPNKVFKRKFAAITLHSLGVSVLDLSDIICRDRGTIYTMIEDYKDPEYKKVKENHKNITYDFINYFLENNIRFKQPKQ